MRSSLVKPLTGRYLIPLIALALYAPITPCHQDVIIELARNGDLRGLPSQYEPATLVIPSGDYEEGMTVVLRIGGIQVEFPECLSILFSKARRSQIQVSASWYHDPEVIPYYLNIELPSTRRSKHGFYDGWAILLELDSGRLIEVSAEFQSDRGLAQRSQVIELDAFCTSEELSQLAPRVVPDDGSELNQ